MIGGQVRLTGRLMCGSVEDVGIIRASLPEHFRLTNEEPGCVSFSVVESDDPLVWHVKESFRDRAAFEAHQARTRASPWWDAMAHIARDYAVTGLE